MTTYAQHLNRPATSSQLDLLSKLAAERGVSYKPPTGSADASRQIKALLALKPAAGDERDRDVHLVREDLARGAGTLAAIREDEIEGYGSTAHWR